MSDERVGGRDGVSEIRTGARMTRGIIFATRLDVEGNTKRSSFDKRPNSALIRKWPRPMAWGRTVVERCVPADHEEQGWLA